MAARSFRIGVPQGTNPLVTGAAVFVLFLMGVWFATSPSKVTNSVAQSLEADAEVQALKAGAVKASMSVENVMEKAAAETTSELGTAVAASEEALASAAADGSTQAETSAEKNAEAKEVASSSKEEEAPKEEEAESSSKDDEPSSSSEEEEKPAAAEGASSSLKETVSNLRTEVDNVEGSLDFPLCPDVGDDFIPCLDNIKAIEKLSTTSHYEHRERHCPTQEDRRRCLVPMPKGYKPHIKWPESRDQIWYGNVPRPSLANYKKDQNWVKAEGDKFVFPGGGTQFKRGATHYIEWVQESCPELKLGDHMVLGFDVGCGVASFGAYLEAFGVKMMSVAPKDEHEAQIQFALERGVSSMVGVMGTMRQPYPANVFDAVHCARCRVPWYKDGGMLLAEVNRLIRPGGYFIWSATPLCLDCKAKESDDREVAAAMDKLTKDMCWTKIVHKVHVENGVAVAVYQKPTDNECYMSRPEGTIPPMCPDEDSADKAWYTKMNACLHKVPLATEGLHGSVWPAEGPSRLREMPAWLPSMGQGLHGRRADEEFPKDTEHWENVAKVYLDQKKTPIDWSTVRNIMDMNAHYGSFGAALARQRAWSMNVIPVSRPNTLPVIFDRGLLGVYHDWCESFNTYPRTYDLLHADHILGHMMGTSRCEVEDVMIEMDRILRPKGYVIVREVNGTAGKVRSLAKALHWTVLKSSEEGKEEVIVYQKSMWRPRATM